MNWLYPSFEFDFIAITFIHIFHFIPGRRMSFPVAPTISFGLNWWFDINWFKSYKYFKSLRVICIHNPLQLILCYVMMEGKGPSTRANVINRRGILKMCQGGLSSNQILLRNIMKKQTKFFGRNILVTKLFLFQVLADFISRL